MWGGQGGRAGHGDPRREGGAILPSRGLGGSWEKRGLGQSTEMRVPSGQRGPGQLQVLAGGEGKSHTSGPQAGSSPSAAQPWTQVRTRLPPTEALWGRRGRGPASTGASRPPGHPFPPCPAAASVPLSLHTP